MTAIRKLLELARAAFTPRPKPPGRVIRAGRFFVSESLYHAQVMGGIFPVALVAVNVDADLVESLEAAGVPVAWGENAVVLVVSGADADAIRAVLGFARGV